MARKSKAKKIAKKAATAKRSTAKAKPKRAKGTVGQAIKDNIARVDALKFKATPLTAAERKELLRLAPRGASVRWISEINIGERHRKDMGDLEALARMIDLAGKLLHPVPIREGDDRLIAGERRVRAIGRRSALRAGFRVERPGVHRDRSGRKAGRRAG